MAGRGKMSESDSSPDDSPQLTLEVDGSRMVSASVSQPSALETLLLLCAGEDDAFAVANNEPSEPKLAISPSEALTLERVRAALAEGCEEGLRDELSDCRQQLEITEQQLERTESALRDREDVRTALQRFEAQLTDFGRKLHDQGASESSSSPRLERVAYSPELSSRDPELSPSGSLEKPLQSPALTQTEWRRRVEEMQRKCRTVAEQAIKAREESRAAIVAATADQERLKRDFALRDKVASAKHRRLEANSKEQATEIAVLRRARGGLATWL